MPSTVASLRQSYALVDHSNLGRLGVWHHPCVLIEPRLVLTRRQRAVVEVQSD